MGGVGRSVAWNDDPVERLERLAQILVDGRVQYEDSDAVAHHLRSVRLDRIRRLTDALEGRAGVDADAVDRVTMRLLLDEYTAAVAHLRAVAVESARRMESTPAALKDIRRFVQQRLSESPPDPAGPLVPPRAS